MPGAVPPVAAAPANVHRPRLSTFLAAFSSRSSSRPHTPHRWVRSDITPGTFVPQFEQFCDVLAGGPRRMGCRRSQPCLSGRSNTIQLAAPSHPTEAPKAIQRLHRPPSREPHPRPDSGSDPDGGPVVGASRGSFPAAREQHQARLRTERAQALRKQGAHPGAEE